MTLGFEVATSGGATLLLSSMFFPWTNDGIGSSMRGYQLADFAFSRPGGIWIGPARWLALVLYLIPLTAAITLVLTASSRSEIRRVRTVNIVVSVVVTVVLVSWLVERLGPGGIGLGAWLGLGGALVVVVYGVTYAVYRLVGQRERNSTTEG